MAIQVRISTSINPHRYRFGKVKRDTNYLIKERTTGTTFVLTTESGIGIVKERK